MFTGLIEFTGKLVGFSSQNGENVLNISFEQTGQLLKTGDSIAVNGVCLTVVSVNKNSFICNLLSETLQKTSIGSKRKGAKVNLETSLKIGDRVGGHFVTGHVDGTAKLIKRKQYHNDWMLTFYCSPEISRGIILKGSVAVDGVSLTITEVERNSFSVNIIPFTWNNTALSDLKINDCANIETDMLGKYVYQYLQLEHNNVNIDKLRNAGF
jgi:riboflavin synthase